MDAKTMLLLGIGMAVLLLLGFCVAPSHSAAAVPPASVQPAAKVDRPIVAASEAPYVDGPGSGKVFALSERVL